MAERAFKGEKKKARRGKMAERAFKCRKKEGSWRKDSGMGLQRKSQA